MNPDWFAGRLRELREQAGLSQKALADKADVALSAIGHLEQGLRKPTWETAIALASALGVGVEAFAVPPSAAAEAPRSRGRPKKGAEDKPAPKGTRGRKGKG